MNLRTKAPPRSRRAQAVLAGLTAGLISVAGLVAGSVAPAVADTPSTIPTGTTYHVDCSAKHPGDGVAAPWNSLTAVAGHGGFVPGDVILFRKGTTCSGRLTARGSGSLTAPIEVGAYGSGPAPVLAGRGTPNRTGTVTLTNVAYWHVTGLHITNSTSSRTRTYRSGVLVTNTGVGRLAGVSLKGLTIDHVVSSPIDTKTSARQFGGITVVTRGGKLSGFDDLLIQQNRISGVSRTGIAVWNEAHARGYDATVRITGNTLRHVKGDSIVLVGAIGARIDHNVSAYGADFWPCPQCKGISRQTANAAIWPAVSHDVRIDHNEVYGEHAVGGDGEAFDVDGSTTDVVLEYNYAHDNAGGAVLFCGSTRATVRFNIFENNKKSTFAFYGKMPAHDTRIYNNTVYNSRSTNADIVRTFGGQHGSGISFKNNVIFNYGSGRYSWPTKKVTTAANTLIGSRGFRHPTDKTTSTRSPGLRRPGSGGTGFGSVSGYAPRNHAKIQHGAAIPSTVRSDFFGRAINAAKPPRGAAA